MPYATYRFNKIIAAETIRFIVTVAIVVYKGLKLVVYRMLTKTVDGSDENLLLYYPLNGKKRNLETGEITEDETMLWDFSNNAKHLPLPSGAKFDDNDGKGFMFPLVD